MSTITVPLRGPSSGSRSMNLSPARTPRWALPTIRFVRGTKPASRAERDEVRGRVDVKDVRGAEERDQDAREGGAGEPGEGGAALDDAVRLGDGALVLADELRQDHPLGREVRRHEAAEQRRRARAAAGSSTDRRRTAAGSRRAAAHARASQTSMVVRPPRRSTSAPLGMPKIAIGRISTARTMLILAADPVVTSTNHGSAR